jgi:hypothetical protein
MNTKSALAITAAALACLSVVAWAATTAPQAKTGSIDGSTTITCNTSTMLFGGAVPPNGFMVQTQPSGVIWINDNGPAGISQGFAALDYRYGVSESTFITPSGYKPMGPVSVFCTGNPGTTQYVPARAW